MSICKTIAFRQLRSKHSFGFISFTTILSIIGLMLGVAFLIIISAFSSGFSSSVESKLSNIDGHLRIQKYNGYELIDENELVYLDSILKTFSDFTSMTQYVEKRAMVRKKDVTEGVIIYAVSDNSLNDIFDLERFIVKGNSTFSNPNSIIIGDELSKQLDVDVDEEIILFDIEKLISDNLIIAEKFNISGIIKTGFPEYDKLLVFISLEDTQLLFEHNNVFNGVICNFTNPEKIHKINEKVLEELDFHYSTTTWKERHAALFEWLNIYDIPIMLLMVFIVLVAVFNITATLWMIVVEKSKNIGILLTMGYDKVKIRKIFLIEGLIVGVIGSLLGLVLALTLLIIQVKYKFIALSSDIYFMDYLPVKISYLSFLIYPLSAILLTIIASSIPSIRASKVEPAEAVRYE